MRWWQQSSKAQICCKRCMKTRVVGNQAEKHISHLLIGPWLLILLLSWIKHLLAMLRWKWSYISCYCWYSGINATAINLNAMPPSFARCVLCRAKILRLKQHHKGQRHPREKASSQEATSSSSALSESETQGGVPQSVSNYSITRLSSSSSNHSFASGNVTTKILSL